jgi:hypothetical protein
MISMVPGADTLIYPIKLFVTYVHEMCHALAALITGGSVHEININPDMSGTTMTSGGIQWIINFAGYLGTMLVGVFSIYLLRKNVNASGILSVFLAFSFITMLYTGFHNLFGTIWGMAISAAILVTIVYFSKRVIEFIAAFISIQLLLNAFYDLKTLFVLSGTGTATDALNMQNSTGIPAVVWACLWIGISVYTTYKVLFK